MENSKSLVVAKKGIFQKIQEFFRKLFKKEKNAPSETENVTIENTEDRNKIQENFINDLKKNTNSDIKELINKIQNGEVSLGEKNDAELSEIEEQLVNYLKYLEQEINAKRVEINSLEAAISKASNN